MVAVLALVGLRMLIGFHFFHEGLDKIRGPKWYSAGFLTNSKGPLSPVYQGMVWDTDGLQRLDPEPTAAFWDEYRQRLVGHYGFSDQQVQATDKLMMAYQQQLAAVLLDYQDDIHQYREGLKRRDANQQDRVRTEVASLAGQASEIEGDLKTLRGPILAKIKQIWGGLERDLNNLATSEQAALGYLEMGVPSAGLMDSQRIDQIIPWFDLVIGALLVLGLFTRVASLAAAGFLATIVSSQWPGASGAAPVYYQAIEMLALLVLAAFAAGRYAGLDFFLYAMRMRCCPPKGSQP